MSSRSFFFAGGGTGGHIYPAIAVAEKIIKLAGESKIHFFVSERNIDSQILSKTNFEYTQLPAKGFSLRPDKLIEFCKSFLQSCAVAKEIIAESDNPIVIGIGGFVAAPVCYAAHKLKVPIKLLNVDIVPGRANKIIARWADEIFVQFEDTAKYFAERKVKVNVVGCPLRNGFENPQPEKVIEQLGIDKNKKTLLVTGASSGAKSINDTICSLLEKLDGFADSWQIVHLTGQGDFENVRNRYADAKIIAKVLDYYDDMPSLLSAADLCIGRAGAVGVAEYAAAGLPTMCMPYPYHKDMHQYLNAGKSVKAGAAIIVDDLPDAKDRAEWLWEELEPLLKDDAKRQQMAAACKSISTSDAGDIIAEKVLRS